MSIQIEMPQLAAEGETAALATWLVSVGDTVDKGEVIAELETDKATVELEAPASGTIAELLIEEGTEEIVPGAVLGSIDADPASAVVDDEPSGASDAADPVSALVPAAAPTPTPTPAETVPVSREARSATPLARRAAAERGVDVEAIEGSGARGRVVRQDVLRSTGEVSGAVIAPTADGSSAPGAPAASSLGPAEVLIEEGFERVRLSAMRKTIARRLTEAKSTVPHFYLRARCHLDELLRVRSELNQGLVGEGSETKISVNDFIVRAAALSLRDVPEANVQFGDDVMHVFDRVDVCVAVATDGGLVTPVLQDADRKGLTTIAEEVKALAQRAREGSLRPDEYQGGTFTVSNLGMYGIETVYPILNPPQACILGVGAAEEQPVVRDGAVVVGRIAALTLAADHRAVDGAVGARLLVAIREHLEDPLGMML